MDSQSRSDTPMISRVPSVRLPEVRRRDVTRIPALASSSDITRTQSLKYSHLFRTHTFVHSKTAEDAKQEAQLQPSEPVLDDKDVTVVKESPHVISKLGRSATFRAQPSAVFKPALQRVNSRVQQLKIGSKQLEPQLQRTVSIVHPPSITRETVEDYHHTLVARTRSKMQTFPSVLLQQSKGSTFVPGWSWLKQLNGIMEDTTTNLDECLSQLKKFYINVSKANSLIEQINMDFQYGILQDDEDSNAYNSVINQFNFCRPGERGRMTLNDGSFPYIGEIFKSQLDQQEQYMKYLVQPLERAEDRKKRNEVVSWVRKTTITLRYPAETLHLTVYLIDAFLSSSKGNKMATNGWLLMGIAALHIAGKLEEPDRATIQRLIRLSNQFYKPDEVYWMEKHILKQLKFAVYPPLAPFLARLVLLGGSLDFPNPNAAKLVMDLSQGILFKSLGNYKLSTVRPAEKAQTALELAVEFLFSKYKLYAPRDLSRYEMVTSQPGQVIGDFAVDLCFDAFLQRFVAKKLPSSAIKQSVPFMPSPIRDVRV